MSYHYTVTPPKINDGRYSQWCWCEWVIRTICKWRLYRNAIKRCAMKRLLSLEGCKWSRVLCLWRRRLCGRKVASMHIWMKSYMSALTRSHIQLIAMEDCRMHSMNSDGISFRCAAVLLLSLHCCFRWRNSFLLSIIMLLPDFHMFLIMCAGLFNIICLGNAKMLHILLFLVEICQWNYCIMVDDKICECCVVLGLQRRSHTVAGTGIAVSQRRSKFADGSRPWKHVSEEFCSSWWRLSWSTWTWTNDEVWGLWLLWNFGTVAI